MGVENETHQRGRSRPRLGTLFSWLSRKEKVETGDGRSKRETDGHLAGGGWGERSEGARRGAWGGRNSPATCAEQREQRAVTAEPQRPEPRRRQQAARLWGWVTFPDSRTSSPRTHRPSRQLPWDLESLPSDLPSACPAPRRTFVPIRWRAPHIQRPPHPESASQKSPPTSQSRLSVGFS